MLGAGAAVALAAAPAVLHATSPMRTVYVARSARALPNTQFARARDCLRRPRVCENGVDGLELVYLVNGTMPSRPTTATVATDTNCAPDATGISHCMNVLRLATGRRIIVRHDHSMMNDPCLSPGEHVRIRVLR